MQHNDGASGARGAQNLILLHSTFYVSLGHGSKLALFSEFQSAHTKEKVDNLEIAMFGVPCNHVEELPVDVCFESAKHAYNKTLAEPPLMRQTPYRTLPAAPRSLCLPEMSDACFHAHKAEPVCVQFQWTNVFLGAVSFVLANSVQKYGGRLRT